MTISKLITHSGMFHADDVFAAMILTTLFPQATIIRTRDTKIINASDTDAIVFDVGMEYNPDRNRFDHHQETRPVRDDLVDNLEIPYSSLGLIWKHYGHAYLKTLFDLDENTLQKLHRGMDRRFIIKVDMGDNGIIAPSEEGLKHPLNITRLIEVMAPDFDNRTPETELDAFHNAMALAKPLFEAKARQIAAGIRSDKVARKAVKKRVDPRWVELPQGMPYLNALRAEKAEDVLYVIMPGKDGEWQLSAVRSSSGDLGCRKPLPASWAGKRDQDFVKASGVNDVTFCHMGRFLAVAQSRDAILKLLTLALA